MSLTQEQRQDLRDKLLLRRAQMVADLRSESISDEGTLAVRSHRDETDDEAVVEAMDALEIASTARDATELAAAVSTQVQTAVQPVKTQLEAAAAKYGEIKACSGNTSIFLYPGVKFNCIDGLITNFHLPESTLIMLVSALYGYEKTMHAYEVAVAEKYRFFSFGDAMLIV